MLLWERPSRPSEFEEEAKPLRDAVEQAVLADEKPELRVDFWRRFKATLAQAQHGKCAWCESDVTAASYGDVEHFRPKSEVSEIVEEAEGSPPPLRQVSARGYDWLAYSWENWFLACEKCNRRYKRTLFPVEARILPLEPGVEQRENPLLLDPFGERPPELHLRFTELGMVEAKSRIGRETIRTLGLDREELRRRRADTAKRIFHLIRKLESCEDSSVMDEILEDVLELGSCQHRLHF